MINNEYTFNIKNDTDVICIVLYRITVSIGNIRTYIMFFLNKIKIISPQLVKTLTLSCFTRFNLSSVAFNTRNTIHLNQWNGDNFCSINTYNFGQID